MGDSMFFYDQELLHIGNFERIKYVENELIVVTFKNYSLQIYGENLTVIYLSDDEMYIQGNIKELDLNNVI